MSTPSSRHTNTDRDEPARQPPPRPPVLCPYCQCALVNGGGESVTQRLRQGMDISKGSFGRVSEERVGEEGSPVAVKRPLSDEQYVFHPEERSCDINTRCLILEAQVLKHLSHPNIQRVYDYNTNPAEMVMELHRHGNLSDFIECHPAIASKPEWILRRSVELASAMRYAHSMPWFISHGDLKSTNILISDAGRIVVMDFGNVQIAPGYPIFEKSPSVGDLNKCRHAPEVIKDGVYGEKGDVYQTAIVMYEMLTGTPPFKGEGYKNIYYPLILAHQIAKDGVRPEIPPNLTQRPGWHPVLKEYENLMKRCWSAYMDKRPTFAKLEEELTEILKKYRRMTQISQNQTIGVTNDSHKSITAFVYVLPAIGFLAVIPLHLLHIQQRAPMTVSEVAVYWMIVSAFVVTMWRVWTVPSSPTAVDNTVRFLNKRLERSARASPKDDASCTEDTVAEEELSAFQRTPFDVRQCPFSCDDLLAEEALQSLNLPVPHAETWNQMCLEVLGNLRGQPSESWCIQLHRLCTERCGGSPTQQEWEGFQKTFIDHPAARRMCRTWVTYEERHNRCRLTRSETEKQSNNVYRICLPMANGIRCFRFGSIFRCNILEWDRR